LLIPGPDAGLPEAEPLVVLLQVKLLVLEIRSG
jgi:hypothetical protein